MNLQVLTFAILILLTAKATGQARVDEHFRQLLKQAGVEFLEPVEARYKPAHVKKNPFQNYDYAIRSRKEGIEIRYLIRPYRQDSPVADAPHVEAVRLVMHLATNDQDFLIAGREVAPEALSAFFNADWGMQYFFRPKTGFADWKHCELLALHKDGQGTAFVLFLFDEPSRELGNRFYALRFRENGIEKPGG